MEDVTTRERLLIAGLNEIREYGVGGFSLRRVAKACGVSCAAPYKHFADKEDMFRAMVDYVNGKWEEEVGLRFRCEGSPAESAADFALAYVKFLRRNPHYRSVLMIKRMGLDLPESAGEIGLSMPAKRLLTKYRREMGLSRKQLREKLFIARSLVYGAVFTLDMDEDLAEERTEMLRKSLEVIFS